MTVATFTFVGLALAASAVSVALSIRSRRAAGANPDPAVLVTGALLALVLAFVDHGAVLSWRLGVGSGEARAVLAGVGVALGLALLMAVGGSLLLGVHMALPAAGGAGRAGTAALWGAAGAGVLGVGLGVFRLLAPGEPLRQAGGLSLALVAAPTAALAVLLFAASGPTPPDASREAARAGLAARVALALVVVVGVACGLEGWWRAGTYATPATAAAAAAALVGVAAVEARDWLALVLRALLVVALVGLLAA